MILVPCLKRKEKKRREREREEKRRKESTRNKGYELKRFHVWINKKGKVFKRFGSTGCNLLRTAE
jgi:hypothetical protein